MANKAEKILESIKETAETEVYAALSLELGQPEALKTPAKQAAYVTRLLDRLSELAGAEAVRAAMEPCGGQCLSDTAIKTAKSLYESSQDMDTFLEELNKRGIGGGYLRAKGSAVAASYKHCYCGLAKQAKNLSPDYCHCSAGWFRKLFSEATGQNVTVLKKAPYCPAPIPASSKYALRP